MNPSNPELNPHEIQKAIRRLEKLRHEPAEIPDFESALTPLLCGYTVDAPRFAAGMYLYRGRKCAKPASIRDLTYPPAECVRSPGRANEIGQAIFYGAAAREIPFFELDAQPGEGLAISKWKTTQPILLNHIGFSTEPETFKDAKRKLDTVYDFVRGTRQKCNLNALVHDYLAYNFARSANDGDGRVYEFTNAISRKLFADPLLDGLLYPTIEMSGNADNVALKPQTVDRALTFVSVEYVAVKARVGMRCDIDILDSATKSDLIGTLSWMGRGLQWKLRHQGERLTIRVENGERVAYDLVGNRVDPE
ncbi:MAG: hypothetical protein GEU89_01925 [Kiloniellaceae bacterium]|nr:hypothetical protein [Kiloniellaceae bacterium]